MKRIYLSAFCTDFRDYDRLAALARAEADTGIELGTSWHYPEFNALLDAQHAINTTVRAAIAAEIGGR